MYIENEDFLLIHAHRWFVVWFKILFSLGISRVLEFASSEAEVPLN